MDTRVEVTIRVVPQDPSIPITHGYAEYTSKDEYVTYYTRDVHGAAETALLTALAARDTLSGTTEA